MKHAFLLFSLLSLLNCKNHPNSSEETLTKIQKLNHLNTLKGKPQMGDWLAAHAEKHISLHTYIESKPTKATETKKYLYIIKPENLDSLGNMIMDLTLEYIYHFFQMEVKTKDDILLSTIPVTYQRQNGIYHQLHSEYILQHVLAPALPDDAFGLTAFTSFDLYPSDDWNFVFGQASLKNRVGIWSLARYGDYTADSTQFKIVLLRNIKTAIHEISHMFGINHCVKYECIMNGINNMEESDRQHGYLCSDCLSKLAWNRQFNVENHLASAYAFYQKYFPEQDIELTYYPAALRIWRDGQK